MERVWREAPMAALRLVCGAELSIEPNEAALRWGASVGVTPAHWQALGRQLQQSAPVGEVDVVVGPQAPMRARRVPLPDGALFWLQPPEPAGATALAEQSRMVAQALGLGFWTRRGDGEAVLWDAQMYRLYGRDPARPPPLIAEWIDEYVHPQDRERARRMLDEDIAAWAPSTLMTVRLADGERWVRAWTRRSVRDDGRPVALGMHQDVTEQHRLEQMQGEAERAARISREKSAFMSLMSHRLRTPLNAVLGFAQLMQQDLHDPIAPRQRERLARIDAAGHELLAMIDDVFELASLDAEAAPAPRVPVSLAQVAAQVREAVEPLARQRGVQLSTDLPGTLPPVATDRRLLCQALVHLVAHSVRRNPHGGWVALQAAPDSAPGWCLLSVSDGGPPLSPEQRELLFDAPVQPAVMPVDGDALIGLDLVRHALERLGARIDAPAAEARGAGLVLRLPLAEAAPAAAPRPPTLKLLCIEDNPVNLMLVQELVAMRPGIQFFSAPDGLSGLALAAAERPDAVLLDLQLPDIGGGEVLARLRADPALARCTVIALSANALPEQIRAARALGFDDYWTKPIDFDQFLAGLDALSRAG